MKIFVTGTRGIPNIPGGVEKHCQDLYPLIASKGHEIYISTRKPYVKEKYNVWRKIILIHTYAPKGKNFEAIVHTFLSVIKAKKLNADILHIHTVGPGLLVPFAKLIGLKVVVTNHGPDYDRHKWGVAAKQLLRLGEYLGCKFADNVIVISRGIQKIVRERCKIDSHIINNGVFSAKPCKQTDFLDSISIIPENYIIAVCRFVPEKGLDLLIEAFNMINTKYKLVIAGDADHETIYSRNLKRMIDENENIIRTGYIVGEPLNQLFCYARLFVLPSFHEGHPIALLEAMSYGLSVLVSDIPANLEIDLPQKRFFKSGDVNDLSRKMNNLLTEETWNSEKRDLKAWVEEKYDWEKIANQTIKVYEETL